MAAYGPRSDPDRRTRPRRLNLENANIAEGGEIFRTNCTQCHNFAGSGGALTNSQYAPSLMNATPEQIWQAVITGPQQMPVFSNETITDEGQAEPHRLRGGPQGRTQPRWSWPRPDRSGRRGSLPVDRWSALLIAFAVWIGAKVR